MEFSRHTDAHAERMDQIAAVLCSLYPPAPQALPANIAKPLERLQRVAYCATHLTDDR